MPTATYSGLSYIFYSADGVSTTYPLGFNFLAESHVVVKLEGTELVLGVDYNLVNGDCVFTTLPATGESIQIARSTPQAYDDRLVDFRSYGAITEDEMDSNQKQVWYLLQEAFETDDTGNVNPTAEYLPWDSVSGMWNAMRSSLKQRVANVEDPATASDAATKGYVDDIAEWGISGVPQSWGITTLAATTNYTLAGGELLDENYLIVSIEGVLQTPGVDFFVIPGTPNSTLSFNEVPPAGQQVGVQNFGKKRFLNEAILGANSVNQEHLQDDCVGSGEIQDEAVLNQHVPDGELTGAKLADASVTGDQVADASLGLEKLKSTGFTTGPGGSFDHQLKVHKDTGALIVEPASVLDLPDFDSELATRRITDLAVPDDNLNMNSHRIINVVNPTGAQDAATKDYVDNAAGGTAKIELVGEVSLGSSGTLQTLFANPGPAWMSDSTYLYYNFVLSKFRWAGGGDVFLRLWQGGQWREVFRFSGLAASTDYEQVWSFWMTNPRTAATRPHIRGGEIGAQLVNTPELGAVTGVQLRGETSNILAGLRCQVYGHRAYA